MSKSILRKKYKTLRSQLDDHQIEILSIEIANQCLALPIWEKSYYHLFLPITKQKEVNTEFILHILQGKDKNVIISKSNFENYTMQHFLLTDTTKLHINSYGIPEPIDAIQIPTEHIEVIFVPLLAFDLFGNRIGYGKGFYDRFLATCKDSVITIGVSFFEAENLINYIAETDIRLDYCVTPKKIYNF